MSETTVTGVITKLCSIKTGFKIKRKVKSGGRDVKPRWWFAIEADLEAEWSPNSMETIYSHAPPESDCTRNGLFSILYNIFYIIFTNILFNW